MSTDRSPQQSTSSPSLRDPERVEVNMDVDEVAPVESLPTSPNAQLDFQNLSISQLFATLTNAQMLPTSSGLLSSPGAGAGAGAGARAGAGAEKKTRSKILINGYFMSFDKISSNKKKVFWRCEYKNTCKARIHTDVDSGEIKEVVHEHNHSKASDDEIKLYGFDPSALVQGQVYKIDKTADATERRKIRKRAADQETAERELELRIQTHTEYVQLQNQIAGTSGTTPLHSFMNSITEGQSSSGSSNGESSQVSPSPSLTLSSTQPSAQNTTLNQIEATFKLALKLIKIWKPAFERRPKSAKNPTTYFQCFVWKNDKFEDFDEIRIEQRDENHLKEALELFCGQKCIGQLLFVVSPKIRIVLNQPMINDWENNQFFLLDASNPSRWFLSCMP